MVPNKKDSKVLLNALLEVLNRMKTIVKEKQLMIINAKWSELNTLSEEQQTVSSALNELLSRMTYNRAKGINRDDCDSDISEMKLRIKQLIMSYKEVESVNIKLLNDVMFATKQKVEKIYNLKPDSPTYTKEANISSKEVWREGPVMLDRFC